MITEKEFSKLLDILIKGIKQENSLDDTLNLLYALQYDIDNKI